MPLCVPCVQVKNLSALEGIISTHSRSRLQRSNQLPPVYQCPLLHPPDKHIYVWYVGSWHETDERRRGSDTGESVRCCPGQLSNRSVQPCGSQLSGYRRLPGGAATASRL